MKTDFPYIWENDGSGGSSLSTLVQQNYARVKNKLSTHGAILFKSFGIDDVDRLEECVAVFPGKALNYVGGNSPRTNLQGKVYTSTEFPAKAFISLHNELSYASQWPSLIFFCCETPASEGGETPIADSRVILQQLSAPVKNAFAEKGVCYIRNLHSGIGPGPSWQDTFETQDKTVVENHCYQHGIEYSWEDDETLRITEKRKAIIKHPDTQEEVWFNQADQFHPSTNARDVYEAFKALYKNKLDKMPQYACFADGTEIPETMLDEVREVTRKNMVLFQWEKGDLLVLDNILSSHGRMPFEGQRKVLVSMLS